MWDEFFDQEIKKTYFQDLMIRVREEYKINKCYPEFKNIFRAFSLVKENDVKVVIIGQDPYHTPGDANGLAFSTNNKILPKSLINIYKEMDNDIGGHPNTGDLSYLENEGVLLLNRILTVRDNCALAHKDYGWLTFTNNLIKYLETLDQTIVYILWGANAQSLKEFIINPNHYTICSPHPSPLSAYGGFFGSRPFSTCNEILIKHNVKPIKWF